MEEKFVKVKNKLIFKTSFYFMGKTVHSNAQLNIEMYKMKSNKNLRRNSNRKDSVCYRKEIDEFVKIRRQQANFQERRLRSLATPVSLLDHW